MDPAPFIRGGVFPASRSVPYPRARAGDRRLPGDTWYTAMFPAGVRLEIEGDADEVEITYECTRPDMTWPGEGGRSFETWRGEECIAQVAATEGGTAREGSTARLPLGTIYLPERLGPRITSVEGVGGAITPTAVQPRWICYGDSIAEGWVTSSPALSWPARVARAHGLDVANLGYAGSARGEIVSAEQIASLDDVAVISLSHGTNCWNRIAFSETLMRETTIEFLAVVQGGQPGVPIVVCSPPLRPEAEATSNAHGASLQDLRRAMRHAAAAFDDVAYVEGADVITEAMLCDDVHPNDEGHAALADAFGRAIAEALHGA